MLRRHLVANSVIEYTLNSVYLALLLIDDGQLIEPGIGAAYVLVGVG